MAPLFLLFSILFLSSALQLHGHVDPTRVSQLSWQPRAFLYKGFLSYEECDHLISLAADKLEESTVTDNSGKKRMTKDRTSFGMFLDRYQDEIVSRIEKRIAAWTFLPAENGEPMQVLRYQTGQKYEPHVDFFFNKRDRERGGHRVATVLMYLSEVGRGGETVFPTAKGSHSQQKNESWSECAQQGFAVKPAKGDALLFFSLHPNASSTDMNSVHGSCPVIEGEKWSATKWIHVKTFTLRRVKSSTGECDDENVRCSEWAADGECQKNPLYMVGTRDVPGSCRKSCGLCVS